jgi:sulfate transport system substrate-binding protein
LGAKSIKSIDKGYFVEGRGRVQTRSVRGIRCAALAAVLAAVLAGGRAAAEEVTLTLVAYSTPREAYEEIIPLFQQTEAGAEVAFETSFGSSGEQSRAVEAGLPADVVALSLEPDVTRLIELGLVAEDWNADEYRGMVTDSVVVLAVREGNPKGIQTWDDLIREGVEVIAPNPATSGGAKWNVMAAYGAQLALGKSEEEAIAYLDQLYDHVTVQDKSARESLQTFLGGKGDVLIAYENEVITARQAGETLDYVIPEQTILIENPVAVVTESEHPEQAAAFVAFLRSPEAQGVFAAKGYRPVVPAVFAEYAGAFPNPPALFTIADLGGWPAVDERFFDPDDGIIPAIQSGR